MPNRKAKGGRDISKTEFLSNARISLANQATGKALEDAIPSAEREFQRNESARVSEDQKEPTASSGRRFHLKVATRSELSDSQLEAVYQLLRANMKPYYDQSKSQWNDESKRAELTHENARFLIVLTRHCDAASGGQIDEGGRDVSQAFSGEQLAAFAHIRFETEEQKIAVTYIYELQVVSAFRGCGIGSWLLDCAQTINRHLHLNRLLLTVFKFNVDAIRFYQKAGFQLDETNPAPAEDSNFDYLIFGRAESAAKTKSQRKPNAAT